MKTRTLSLLLSILMLLCAAAPAALGEGEVRHSLAAQYSFDSLTVGTSTAFTGNFLSPLFGSNGVDMDVRELIHAYSPVRWATDGGGTYKLDTTVVSNLLVSNEVNGDRTYRIFLYSDLYYSDGSRITAADYVFTVLLSASPEIAAIGGVNPDLSYIVGMDAYTAGEAETVSGLRLWSDSVFSITVKASALPNFYELGMLDFKPFPASVIAPGCTAADDGAGAYIRDGETPFSADMLRETLLDPVTGYVSHPSVVSGAYVLTSYDGEVCEFDLNPMYKGDAEGRMPAISHLTYKTIPTDRIAEALRTGEIGLANKITNGQTFLDTMQLVSGGTYRVTSYPRSGGSFISFSCERIAMSDLNVRKAIAYSFDKQAAVDAYAGDLGVRVDGYYGVGQWMYSTLRIGTEEWLQESEDSEPLSLDVIPVYNPDPEQAGTLLNEAGWTLNLSGRTYNAGRDTVRCKAFDRAGLEANGQLEAALAQGGVQMQLNGADVVLIPLSLTMYYPEGNTIADCLQQTLVQPLAAVGIELQLQPVPFQQLLQIYYRNVDRDCDMLYLATNFTLNMDLSYLFATEAQYQQQYNTSGLLDDELYAAACDLIHTQPGDFATYCRKWLDFQTLYQQKVPGIFVYSNVYMDVYTYALTNYQIVSNITWSHAILSAYMSDPLAEPEAEPDVEPDDESDDEFFD